jgi:SAM-dependent methyltransferase
MNTLAEQLLTDYLDSTPMVLRYREAYVEAHGCQAAEPALPATHAWPESGEQISYAQKLTGLLPIREGIGAEIGPLNFPLLKKTDGNVLYVDHLDTAGLQAKYPTLTDIVDVDRPMQNNSLADTLAADAPLDYLVASQVFEHVPNPIAWLQEIAAVLREGGLLALSVPDRRFTFDLYRQESRASDMVAAFYAEASVPNVRMVYDHHAQAAAVNMHWAIPESLHPHEVVAGRGSRPARRVAADHLGFVRRAHGGEYLDVHCWVFTPVSFLLIFAELAADGFIPYRCRQFYPTDPSLEGDRSNHSMTIVLEKADAQATPTELRKSFLLPLGPVARTA